MYDETMFTTTDTGRPAPTYYQRFDQPRLYWRDDYWQQMQEAHSRSDDSQRIAALVEREGTSRSSERSKRQKPPLPLRNCAAESCGSEYRTVRRDQKTCGNPVCQKEYAREKQRAHYQKWEKRRKEAAAWKAPRMCEAPNCDNEFIPKTANQRCCNAGCSADLNRERAKEWRERNKDKVAGYQRAFRERKEAA